MRSSEIILPRSKKQAIPKKNKIIGKHDQLLKELAVAKEYTTFFRIPNDDRDLQ